MRATTLGSPEPTNFYSAPTPRPRVQYLSLSRVSDNDGTDAPVTIKNGSTELLMDGNEIDANSSLYINHNTDNNTYINPSGGRVAIGTTGPSAMLEIETDGSTQTLALTNDWRTWSLQPYSTGNGNLGFVASGVQLATVSGATGAWLVTSDRRLKKNIRPLTQVLPAVEDLGTYTFEYKHDKANTQMIGMMAQELQQYFPELVQEDKDGYLRVSYAELSVVAIKALQELSEEVEILRGQISEMKSKVGE